MKFEIGKIDARSENMRRPRGGACLPYLDFIYARKNLLEYIEYDDNGDN